MPTLAVNKRASFDYEVLDKYEAGIVLAAEMNLKMDGEKEEDEKNIVDADLNKELLDLWKEK